MKNFWAVVGVLALTYAAPVQAEDCVMHVVRTACKGQEEVSYKKCDGKKECDEVKAAADAGVCSALASKGCANSRLDITKFKIITAKFQGKDLVGGFNAAGAADPAGTNFCSATAPDLNKCE